MLVYKLFFVPICFILFGCNNKQSPSFKNDSVHAIIEKKAIDLAQKDTFSKFKEKVFKRWLADTLQHIKVTHVVNKNQNQTRWSVSSDSLELSITISYDISVKNKEHIMDNDVKRLVWLLKKYHQYPGGNFRLKLESFYSFVPSPVPKKLYDITYDIDSVALIQNNGKRVIKLDFNRASLKDIKEFEF